MIQLTKPREDPQTGKSCPLLAAGRIYVNTFPKTERLLQFTVFFGHLNQAQDDFVPLIQGPTYTIANMPEEENVVADENGDPIVGILEAFPEFDILYARAKSTGADQYAWDIVGDEAIYWWLLEYEEKNEAGEWIKPYDGVNI